MSARMSTANLEEPHSVPTLSAVAKLAGVSSITVSRVVRLPGLVAPETRGRVESRDARTRLCAEPARRRH
jgi:LacI family gluconate utilization system Gnt-I transcriptional repressor